MTIEQMAVNGVLLVAAGLLVIGVLFVGASDRLRVPAALLSLGIGIVFGSDVLGLVDVDDMTLVRDLSVVALMIILFEGGLTTKPSVLRTAGLPGFVLANVGVVVTAGVTAVGVELLLSTGWETDRRHTGPRPRGKETRRQTCSPRHAGHDSRTRPSMIPNADTVFAAGDFLVLAVDRDVGRVADATAWARGETATDPDPEVS